MTYCRLIVWVPIPLRVMYEDDLSGERNPGVCVRQQNWRNCLWVGREFLKPFDYEAMRKFLTTPPQSELK
ncbi:hypothetical protein ACVIN2_000459 [Bradyrhizobium sp. USDA 3650]